MPTRHAALLVLALLAWPSPAFAAPRLATGRPEGITRIAAAVVLTGFRAQSVTFASPVEGWVLGSIPCGARRCLAVAHTRDAGHTWTRLPAPATSLNPDPGVVGAGPGVSSIRFADAHDGWAFGPELWATHDGGHTWSQLHVPSLAAGKIVALEAARGTAHAVLYDGQIDFRITSSGVTTNAWRLSSLKIPVGAGAFPAVQLVLSGGSGWLLQNDRTVVNGARLVGGLWHSWQPVCAGVVGPAYIASASPANLVAVCDVGLWGMPSGEHLYASHDGGQSFVKTGTKLPTTPASGVASPSPGTIVVAGYRNGSMRLVGSVNGGRTWTIARSLGSVTAWDLGFTTPFQGVIVTSGGRLYMSHDGGRSWAAVPF